MILVDALFVNKGGGAVLLGYLINSIMARPEKDQFYFLLDPRFERPPSLTGNYTVIPNSIKERIGFYKARKQEFSGVFCFANTPPPIKMKGKAYTYLHNQKLLEAPALKFKNKHFFLQYIKYLYLRRYNRNTDYYIVQTQHMVDGVVDLKLKDKQHCLTIPFYDDQKYKQGQMPFADRVKDEFVFISNPTPQKNYPTLFDAWEYLLEQGHTPLLHVTVDETAPHFLTRIEELNKRGARIKNHAYLDPRELYYTCPYLIFPAIMESFGLPLIEAVDSGMKVLASDLPFVYDVIRPSIAFKPMDKQSIAGAVLQALGSELPFPQVVTHNRVEELIDLLVVG